VTRPCTRSVVAAAVLGAVALLAGCASSTSPRPGGSGSGTTSVAASGSSSAANLPHRVVSLSPSATETLFAIGAGQQVVAVDKYSDFPATAPKTTLDGNSPSVEAIAAYRPDLVVVADDTDKLKSQLGKLAIPVLVEPAPDTLTDAYSEIDALGVATGHSDGAKTVVASMRSQISALLNGVPHRAAPLSYYHELDPTLYTATSKTFIGQLYALAGLRNIADAAAKGGNQYPQLSAEYLLRANPQLVFLADTKCCAQNAQSFGKRAGFGPLAAVVSGHVVTLDDDIASRWGPRIVDFLSRIVAAVKADQS
jgi:iron complex transport system substrate-binding protein